MSGEQAVRIVAVPPGEAPLWVREKWVGLELPLATAAAQPRTYATSGALSGPRNLIELIVAHFLGRIRRQSGYAVETAAALAILAGKSSEAAAWWRENAPRVLVPKRKFLFQAQVCQLVEAGRPTITESACDLHPQK